MAKNRELVAMTRKTLKNAIVKATSTSKTYLRVALPTFDATTGAVNKGLSDLTNAFIEGDGMAADDALTGTFNFGLRYYSENADGTERTEKFYRWELLEQVDVDGERTEAIHAANLNVLKAKAKSAGTAVAATEDITDKW